MSSMESILPYLTPTIAALAVVSIVVVTSTFFKGKETIIKTGFLILTLAVGISILAQNEKDLSEIWQAFKSLSEQLRFVISLVVVSGAYFGGSLYIDGEKPDVSSNLLETPASCDSIVEFTVPSTLPVGDKELFELMFDKLKDEIVRDLPTIYEMPSEAVQWVDRMVKYTVAGGKMNRGLALMDVQKTLAKAKGQSLSTKERCQSAALGWCIEFLQAFFLVADDVMDDSVTRRGQPCWFRLPEIKLIAINDSFILESCVFKILKRYFGKETYYPQLVDLFIEVTRQTELGQLLDLTSQQVGGPIDLTRFTMERYTSIVKYKTAFYSFYLPVALGMIVSGVKDPKQYETARKILLIMGEYFQVQDDYLDCYGSPEVIGKIGTDIQDNKCGWLVVQALLIVNPQQRKTLEENYGRHDEAKVAKVKALYHELNIEAIFHKYEDESYKQIKGLMSSVTDMPIEVFEFLLKKIYKRSK